MSQITELHLESDENSRIDFVGNSIVVTGWLSNHRHLVPDVIICLHGKDIVCGRFVHMLEADSSGLLRFEIEHLEKYPVSSRRGRGGKKAGWRWIGEDQANLPDLPLDLTPYPGPENPPFFC